MAWTLEQLLDINKGNNPYTPIKSPVLYTVKHGPSQSDILSQILASPNQSALILDQQLIASNRNDQWNKYGLYTLDADGKLLRTDAGSLHADLGQKLPLSGKLNTPEGVVKPRIDSYTGGENDRWVKYGLYSADGTRLGDAGTLYYDMGGDSKFDFSLGAGASLLTGGLYDVATGHTPFNSAIENASKNLGLDEYTQKWLKDLSGDMFSGGFAQLPKAYQAATANGEFDWGRFIDRAVDPAGTIDYTVRETGNAIKSVAPEVSPYLQAAGTAIGGILGTVVPFLGNGVGAAIGSGIGSKLSKGTDTDEGTYGRDLLGAGAAYLGAGGGAELGSLANSAIGGTAGNIAGGAVQGGLTSAASQLPTAIETGNWKGVGNAALTGAVIGGGAAGLNEAYGAVDHYFNPGAPLTDAQLQQITNKIPSSYEPIVADPTLQLDNTYNPYQIAPDLTAPQIDYSLAIPKTTLPSTPYDKVSAVDYNPFKVDTSLQTLPKVTPIDSTIMGGSKDAFQNFMNDKTFNKAGDIVNKPAYNLTDLQPFKVDTMLANPLVPYVPPDDLTFLREDQSGDLSKALQDAAGLFGGLGGSIAGSEGAGTNRRRKDSSAYVEPPMFTQRGKNSKGLTAEEYERLYHGMSFIPDSEIERYNKKGLYYT